MNTTTSETKIESNQENALKSTGPKTEEGRAISRMNALKHGLRSQQAVVQGLQVKESKEEFMELHQRFWEELEPVGPVEEMLAGQIVTLHWRMRRVWAAESGEIVLSVDEDSGNRNRKLTEDEERKLWPATGDTIKGMRDSTLGNSIIEKTLRELRVTVEQEGFLSETAVRKTGSALGGNYNDLTREMDWVRRKSQENPENLEAAALNAKQKTEALAFLDEELNRVMQDKARCVERDENAEKARGAASLMPSTGALERILRYETALERQLNRAMTQLERIQERRKGKEQQQGHFTKRTQIWRKYSVGQSSVFRRSNRFNGFRLASQNR